MIYKGSGHCGQVAFKVDYVREKLSTGGQEVECGWLPWQIAPEALLERTLKAA